MRGQEYINSLTAHGKISFTLKKLAIDLSLTSNAAASLIRRLKQRGSIASPTKGYYLILTPEFRALGCLPPDFFIDDLMKYLKLDYYVALTSAALYHGAAHQQPQVFQVMIARPFKKIHCGRVVIQFITNQNLGESESVNLKTRTGLMRVASAESTLRDMLNYIKQSGGINHVATIIDELTTEIDANKLSQLAIHSKSKYWIQRLGYLLDTFGHKSLANSLYKVIKNEKLRIIALAPHRSCKDAIHDHKWRILINIEIESDLQDDTY